MIHRQEKISLLTCLFAVTIAARDLIIYLRSVVYAPLERIEYSLRRRDLLSLFRHFWTCYTSAVIDSAHRENSSIRQLEKGCKAAKKKKQNDCASPMHFQEPDGKDQIIQLVQTYTQMRHKAGTRFSKIE